LGFEAVDNLACMLILIFEMASKPFSDFYAGLPSFRLNQAAGGKDPLGLEPTSSWVSSTLSREFCHPV